MNVFSHLLPAGTVPRICRSEHADSASVSRMRVTP
jgi:hypothetical protein